MENTSRGTALKIAICLLVAVFAQTTFVRLVPDSVGRWLAYIDWLLLVVVYICLQRNPVQALLTAAAAGLVQDAFSRGQAIGVVQAIGVSGFAYVLAAYAADRIVSVIVADTLLVRFATVASASVINTFTRYAFYKLLKFNLPVLIGGQGLAAAIVFGLVTNLIVSVLLYMILDRVFRRDSALRLRRNEARRIRSKFRL
ncbi:MAG: rod shape-determining protein MreD [Blastocatellales bacterium]